MDPLKKINDFLHSKTVIIIVIVILLLISLPYNCNSEPSENSYAVINKCCDLHEYYNKTTEQCQDAPNPLNSSIWMVPVNFSDTSENFTVIFNLTNPPRCSQKIKTIYRHCEENHQDAKPQLLIDKAGALRETTGDDYDVVQLTHLTHHFCIDTLDNTVIFRICPASCDEDEPCFRKCCPHGHHYDFDTQMCSKSNNNHHRPLPVYNHPNHPPSNVSLAIPRVTTGHDLSWGNWSVSTGWSSADFIMPFKILPNDTIVLFSEEKNSWVPQTGVLDYCVDNFHSTDGSLLCDGEQDVLLLSLSASHKMEWNAKFQWLETLAKVTLIIALVCLLLTAVIVFLLIDNVNLHSWTRFSFVTSEFIFLFLFSMIHLKRFKDVALYPASCKAFAVSFHYAGLMTVCWLSVVNFDLYWTFKVLKPSSSSKFDVRRFICYVCFAMGLPLLIVIVGLGIQNSHPRLEPKLLCRKDVGEKVGIPQSNVISPGYGEENCLLTEESLGVYWYYPLSLLLLANLIFFVATTHRMRNLRRMTRRASIDSTTGKQRQSNQIFIKIFIVSGVTWNIELIGWLFRVDVIYNLDIVHHLQAMALFYIFVCKKSVLRSLQRKYPIITKIIPPLDSKHHPSMQFSGSTDAGFRIRFGRKASNSSSSSVAGASIIDQQDSIDLQSPLSTKPVNNFV